MSVNNQGPVVQNIVSLTSSLRVISLTVLADLIYNILIFFAEKPASVAQLDAPSDWRPVQPPPRSATFFRGHSLPFADSRRAVVSFWRKNVHNTG